MICIFSPNRQRCFTRFFNCHKNTSHRPCQAVTNKSNMFLKWKWMFYKRESEKRRKEKIDSWNTTHSSEAFKHICRRPVLLAMNSTCATVVGRDPLIMAWLYSIVTFSLLSDVLTIVVTLFLNYKKCQYANELLSYTTNYSGYFAFSFIM